MSGAEDAAAAPAGTIAPDGFRRPRPALALVALTLALAVLIAGAGRAGAASPAPPNDDFDHATVVGMLPFTDSEDTSGATTAPDDPYCGGNMHTVWYRFTPSSDLRVIADVSNSSGFDPTLSLYTGTRGHLNQLRCQIDTGRIGFTASAGTTYYLMVASFFGLPHGGQLQITLRVPAAPANDDFAQATELGALPAFKGENPRLATSAPDDPDCFGNTGSVWFRFTPDTDVRVSAFAEGDYETTLSVYTGERGSLTQLGCAKSEGKRKRIGVAKLGFLGRAGTTYYMMVGAVVSPGPQLFFGLEPVHTFDPAMDFARAPNEQNPNPDSYGDADVWRFEKSTGEGPAAHPSGYSLLGHFTAQAFGIAGLEQWQGPDAIGGPDDRLPAIGVNATGQDQQIGSLAWPAGTLRLQPGPSVPAVIAVRSLLRSGNFVTLTISDLDPGGGDGIRFYLLSYQRGFPHVVRSGTLANGGAPQTVEAHIGVTPGRDVFVVIDDGGNGDASFDSTGVSLSFKVYG